MASATMAHPVWESHLPHHGHARDHRHIHAACCLFPTTTTTGTTTASPRASVADDSPFFSASSTACCYGGPTDGTTAGGVAASALACVWLDLRRKSSGQMKRSSGVLDASGPLEDLFDHGDVCKRRKAELLEADPAAATTTTTHGRDAGCSGPLTDRQYATFRRRRRDVLPSYHTPFEPTGAQGAGTDNAPHHLRRRSFHDVGILEFAEYSDDDEWGWFVVTGNPDSVRSHAVGPPNYSLRDLIPPDVADGRDDSPLASGSHHSGSDALEECLME